MIDANIYILHIETSTRICSVALSQGRKIIGFLDLAEGMNHILKQVPKDPWGNDYQYRYPGTHNTNGADLFSFGPDGREGNDDIDNWTQK